MFRQHHNPSLVICEADYGRIKEGAVVPKTNELYSDVEQWLSEGNVMGQVQYKTQSEIAAEQLANWRASAKVSAFQAKQALDEFGHIDAVEALMADSTTPKKTKRAWELATEFRRESPTVLELGTALGLTDEQLDQLFEHAATIDA